MDFEHVVDKQESMSPNANLLKVDSKKPSEETKDKEKP